jgi:hypothetical protein
MDFSRSLKKTEHADKMSLWALTVLWLVRGRPVKSWLLADSSKVAQAWWAAVINTFFLVTDEETR